MGSASFERHWRPEKNADATEGETSVTVTPTSLAPKQQEPETAVAQPETHTSAPALTTPTPRMATFKEPTLERFAPEAHAAPGLDAGEAKLDANRGATGRRLEDATKALENSKQLTPGEKIAMALVSLLPALGGGLVGAAIHNPTSVAAGISGGLEGSSKGVGMINQDVKDRVALAQKKVEGETTNLRDSEKDLLGRQVHNSDYVRGLKDQDVNERNTAGLKTAEDANQTRLHLYLGNQHEAGENYRALVHERGENSRHAAEKADANDKVEQSFAENYQTTKDQIKALREEIQRNGTAVIPGGDAAHAAAIGNLPKNIMTGVYKTFNANARAVPEGVAEKMVAQRLPLGLTTRNEITLKALDELDRDVDAAAVAHRDNAKHPSHSLDQAGKDSPAPQGSAKDKWGF